MSLLEPTSIAVIGASDEAGKLGHFILSNLLTQGYKGKVFPVNPKHAELMGKKCYPSVDVIADAVDMALIVTPASTVIEIAQQCGKKKVQTLVVISAGFGETHTEEGKKMEVELAEVAKQHGMRLIGPNCLGLLRPGIQLNASFAADLPEAGSVALISQSGALAVALIDESRMLHLGLSLVASIGNKADIDECDMLELCADDKQTKVIGLYLESIKDGSRFLSLAADIAKKKPIVLIKSGTSMHGAAAVSSHTGALAGSSTAIDAACKAAGIHRASSTEEFLTLLILLSTQPQLVSPNVAVITNAGGLGVLATDAAEKAGLILPELEQKTIQRLQKSLPPAATALNPVDVLGDAKADRYKEAIFACANDPNIDGLAILLTPQVMTPAEEIAEEIVDCARKHPLLPIVTGFMGGKRVIEAREILRRGNVPTFETAEEALAALAKLRPLALPMKMEEKGDEDNRETGAASLLKGKHGLLDDETAATLLAFYDLPSPDQAIARTVAEAVEIADEIGYPVIAKVSSPDILHKSDIGGVRANLKTKAQVEGAYKDILAACKKNAPAAGIRGVLIQKFLPAGNEFIIGGLQDPVFGPLVMVGLGGIYTELFKDTAFRLAPVATDEAYRMLEELKAWKLLTGMRGQQKADIDALAEAVSKISELLSDCPSIKELDLNPVLVNEKGIVIADAKIVVGEKRGARFEK